MVDILIIDIISQLVLRMQLFIFNWEKSLPLTLSFKTDITLVKKVTHEYPNVIQMTHTYPSFNGIEKKVLHLLFYFIFFKYVGEYIYYPSKKFKIYFNLFRTKVFFNFFDYNYTSLN